MRSFHQLFQDWEYWSLLRYHEVLQKANLPTTLLFRHFYPSISVTGAWLSCCHHKQLWFLDCRQPCTSCWPIKAVGQPELLWIKNVLGRNHSQYCKVQYSNWPRVESFRDWLINYLSYFHLLMWTFGWILIWKIWLLNLYTGESGCLVQVTQFFT